ncbi:hypothetical protein BDP27DRAFT_1245711 [Rhodocollybia butyracea]|uniref:Integrase core domain-containing protein n=1 Tax=Rhodocollybia butyracea TaxID=206335 RepID=A0A9P5P1G4_9AGAR|nr:hypothetical protein BDP27DRAFT_1245711 [Rhodocollybia butyracea]
MWGSSTHNTRIERLWVEVGSQFARAWRAFFFRLEELHGLDRKNSFHLWLLHFLFLNLINEDCKEFVENWNAHPISGEGHDRSPNDLLFLGQLDHGVYEDCPEVDPNLLRRFYGVHGKPVQRQAHQTGAGHPPDEEQSDTDSKGTDDGSEWMGIGHSGENELEGEDKNEFNAEAVEAPVHTNPFQNDETYRVFEAALDRLDETGQIPLGYSIHPSEWEEDGYPALGSIRSGRKGSKRLEIALPDSVWRPRSVRWVQGLYLMDQLMDRQS